MPASSLSWCPWKEMPPRARSLRATTSLPALQFAIGLEGTSTRVRSIRPVRLVLRLFLYAPSNRPCNKLLGLKLLGQFLQASFGCYQKPNQAWNGFKVYLSNSMNTI